MTKHTPLKSLFSLAIMLAFTSCDDDETKVTRLTSTQFTQDNLTFSENESSSEILIILNQSAAKDGVITLSVTADNLNGFTTTPAIVDGKIELPIVAGQGDATFSFAPVDNAFLNESQTQTIDFTIGSVSEGFSVGTKKVLSVVIFDNESPALVRFQQEQGSGSILENSTSTSTVIIGLSHASPGSGSIEVSLVADNATYGINYITEPVAVDGKIALPVEPGVDHLEFKIIPLNDQLYNEERTINYTISRTSGSVMLGHAITNTLKITDDELLGHTKGYTTGGGGWGYKREYKYDEQGKISKILWEQSAPGNHLAGTYSYEYDGLGNVVKMIESDLTETNYTWENGRIVKEESFRDELLKQYVLYGYDDAGNVGESSYYYRQPNGDLKLGLLIVYLYKLDGNIYKQISYSPIEGSDDYYLISTKTWEYSTKENPFSMVEILPNQQTQPNLPVSYRLEEGGHDFLFEFTYQFNAEGKPTKRTATSSGINETTFYQYY